MFKSPFSFEGRIRRLEYGLSYVIYIIAIMLLATTFAGDSGADFIMLGAYIPLLWFLWAQGAKRCHDVGNSGWYQIIPFYVFYLMFADGQYGPNGYGDNPKGVGNFDAIDQVGAQLVD